MQLSNQEILAWAEANNLRASGSLSEASNTANLIRSRRRTFIANTIASTLLNRQQLLEADLAMVSSSLLKLGIQPTETDQEVASSDPLKGVGDKINLALLRKFAISRGYSSDIAARTQSYLLANTGTTHLVSRDDDLYNDRGRDEGLFLNMPQLDEAYTSRELGFIPGIGEKTHAFITELLTEWNQSNPQIDSAEDRLS